MFTDIEGSTRLLERLGEEYGAVLGRHRDLLAAAFAAHGGVVVETEGDALFVAFGRPTAAVAAAVDGQRAILGETWPPGAPVRVRMGVHCGEVERAGHGYVGMAVHVAARVSAAAHGGQILITEVTARLAGDPDALDLGRHRLKDVGEFRLLQLRAAGLAESFPAPRTLSALPNNLPAPVDSFVGRQMELAEIAEAIRADRLVTLTGPGGSGKTRLALEVAAALVPAFADGVWFVALAAIGDGTRLAEAVARVLRVSDVAGEAIADTLANWLGDRDLLLILDNCEHVVNAARGLCQRLLPACGRLRILATSREFLDVRGEHAMQTPPLALPADPALAPLSDAVQLFLARARAGAPSFRPDDADLGTVVQVCRRLDGLPLAIELAAVRLRAMSLSQLAARLDDQFWRLTAGGRAEIPRQRTLETVVAWSYDLLSEPEQHVLARLAVFPDHFTLEMAEAVVSDPPVDEPDVLDIVSRLVGKSLVATVNAPDGLRYQLLEMLRQYGRDRLTERGDAARFQQRLLGWAMSGIEELESVIRTPAQDDALRAATINAVTYRAAMDWAAAHGQHRAALRIASMVPLTHHRGDRRAEILKQLSQADPAGQLDDAAAGHAWAAVSNLAFEQNDWPPALQAGANATQHFQAAGLPRLAAWARYIRAHSAWGAGQLAEVDRLIGEVVASFRQEHDEMGLGYSLWVASLRSANLAAAKEMAGEADALLRRVGAPIGVAHNAEGRGIIAFESGEFAQAAGFITDAIEIFASYGNIGCTAHALEAAAVVVGTAGQQGAGLPVELLVVADELRRQSGQGHRPWEIRARLGNLEDHIAVPGSTASAPA
ncbi:MAG TPA: adenylate/guanylate cyclase domain-containing protein, partial [Streptosporangiaceae bacterium]|nr:adenylate/guanylate cyclase domain-containing protein [Streptosporangiaceae bacterium]